MEIAMKTSFDQCLLQLLLQCFKNVILRINIPLGNAWRRSCVSRSFTDHGIASRQQLLTTATNR